MRRPTSRAMQRAFSGSFTLFQSHWNSTTTLVGGEGGENGCYTLLQCHALFDFFDDADPPFPILSLMRGRDRDPVARGPDLVKSPLQRRVIFLKVCPCVCLFRLSVNIDRGFGGVVEVCQVPSQCQNAPPPLPMGHHKPLQSAAQNNGHQIHELFRGKTCASDATSDATGDETSLPYTPRVTLKTQLYI